MQCRKRIFPWSRSRWLICPTYAKAPLFRDYVCIMMPAVSFRPVHSNGQDPTIYHGLSVSAKDPLPFLLTRCSGKPGNVEAARCGREKWAAGDNDD